MHLSSLWNRYHRLIAGPAAFAAKLNNELVKVVKTDESFATALCGLIDLKRRTFSFANAGSPQVLLMHADESHEFLEGAGLPLAIMEDADYAEASTEIRTGDSLLLFSDGAVEVQDAAGETLDLDGLVQIVSRHGGPASDIQMQAVEEEFLKYSNGIRLDDDLTLIQVRFTW